MPSWGSIFFGVSIAIWRLFHSLIFLQKRNKLPLTGIQVIEFGHELAGPATGMILADLGATVIHVEKPNTISHPYDATLNRGKRCITLDLKEKKDLEQALKLISRADVLIENFRPGVMGRFGLDFELLCADNPQLIALSLPTFSKKDKKMRDRKGSEAMLATYSGVFSKMGTNRTLMGVEPSYSPLPLAAAYGSTIGASVVVMALQSREKTGYGDYIEVPLAAALAEGLIAYNVVDIEPKPRRYMNLREKEIERRIENNLPFDLSYQELFSAKYMDPFFRPYRCKDGRTYYVVSIAHKKHTKRVMQALGVYDKVMQNIKDMNSYPIDDVYLSKSEWGNAGSFETYPVSPEWSEMINHELEQAFLTKNALEWEKILSDHGAIGGVHRTLDEWMRTEHARKSGLFVKVDDVKFGPMIQPGTISWSEELADQHLYSSRQLVTPEEALKVLKPLKKTTKLGSRNQGWLAGIKVLDLSNVIAGPHTGTILARYGAEVIKLDSAQPSFGPSYIYYAFNSGQGKSSILVDIRSTKGYQLLTKLIKDTDIVIFNATTKQLKQLKLDKDSIKKINPKVIFCHLDLYGGTQIGPMTNTLGYDDVAQAVSGIMTRFGGGLDTPEEHAHLGTLDVMCGFAATLSIAVSLYHKNKTGRVLRARTSLAAMSGLLQLPFAYDYAGRGPMNEPSGRDIKGNHELSRFYECADGWIFMDSSEQELDKLEKIFSDILYVENKEDYLEHIFKQELIEYWLECLIEQDIAVAHLNTMEKFRDEFSIKSEDIGKTDIESSSSFIQWANHPSGLEVNTIAPCAVLPRYASVSFLNPTEKYGDSTYTFFYKRGYSKEKLDELKIEGVINNSWSKDYYPS